MRLSYSKQNVLKSWQKALYSRVKIKTKISFLRLILRRYCCESYNAGLMSDSQQYPLNICMRKKIEISLFLYQKVDNFQMRFLERNACLCRWPAMPDLQRYPWKLCLIEYELDIRVLVWESNFRISWLSKVTEELSELNTFLFT